MELSKLNHKIEIVKIAEIPDGYGGFSTEKIAEISAWANVVPFKMVENSSMSRLDKKITTKFTVRSNSKITPYHKIIYMGKTYEIARIRSISRDEGFMEICAYIK